MELTLTGGTSTTPTHSNVNVIGNNGSNTIQQGNVLQAHKHTHSSHHNHNHSHQAGGQCCNAHPEPRPIIKICASTLLPTKEAVGRFKTDRIYRMSMLSNVVRGGPYFLFLQLITVLVSNDEVVKTCTDDDNSEDNNATEKVNQADPVELAQLLDGYGADGHTLAHWCAKRGECISIQYLVTFYGIVLHSRMISLCIKCSHIFFCFIHLGDEPRFLSFLIEKSYVRNGAQLLIDLHIPSKDSVGMYPLHWAVTEGAIPLVAMLLQHLEERPSPPQQLNQRGLSSSSASSLMQDENGDSDNNAQSCNIGIDAQDNSGCTPLLIASQYGHPDLAAFLIRRGANPNAVDSRRDTALHWAAYKGSVEVCGMLLHLLGVEGHLDAVDAFGQTPLHLASLRGNTDTVMFLMEEAGSIGERSGGSLDQSSGRVGSKVATFETNRAAFLYPGKLLSMKDKEEKTPKDLAIKKKKVGCELLLQEYEEKYLLPKRSIFSQMGQTCKDLFSIRNWKAWMGMSVSDMPIGQSPTFPFYWMTAHILLGGIVYATTYVGIGGRRVVGNDALLWDKVGLHFFFVVASIATWANLYYVYKTNPGVLDARHDNNSAPTTCCIRGGGGGYARDKVSIEMDAVTSELRRQYDEIIESYSKDFPSSQEERVPLCHTCRIVKPLRSKHCRVARRCVLVFDHHCPFVGTTIGLYNYIYFYLFLLSFCLMEVGFITAWIMFLARSKVFPKGAFLMGGYLSLYLIPVGFMAFYHTTLVLTNSSTNEQMNARKYRYLWSEGRFHNPFNQGSIRNILQRCWQDRSSYELGQTRTIGEVELREERQPMLNDMV